MHIFNKPLIPFAFAATKRMRELASKQYGRDLGIGEKDYLKISKSILDMLGARGLTVKEIKAGVGGEKNISPIVNLMCDQDC